MKTQIISLILLLSVCLTVFAQEESETKNSPVIYTLLINSVPDGFNFPLIGYINMGRGNHSSAHIGFVNIVKRNFNGGQVGFINYAGGDVFGAQIGYINTTPRRMNGAQIGFVNTALRETQAVQVGFVNTCGKTLKGAQIGFVNTSLQNTDAVQVGFVNTCTDSLKGAQVGFVNAAVQRVDGAQVGYVNVSKKLNGLQVGFVNVADTVENGMPLGFLSIVRKGGYHALELSVNEMYPINLSYKIGVSKLYTSFVLSYNPANEKSIAFGAGLGSVLPIRNKLYFNPEIISQTLFFDGFQQTSSFTANLGYNINQHLSVLAGPSLVWHYGNTLDRLNDPFFSFSKSPVSNKGNLITGARLAIRYKF